MDYTRREVGKLALAALALPRVLDIKLLADSKFSGVQIGAITYSYRTISDAHEIIKAMHDIGLSEVELMSGDAEKLAGIPPLPEFGRGGRRAGAPGGARPGGARRGHDGVDAARAASSRALAPSSHSSQRAASASPRSHRASDCSSVAAPCSSSVTTRTSSSRASS